MFGLGKLIGSALDAIGLGSIAPYVSLAVNAMTGNVAGIATDILGVISNMKGFGFLKKVAQFAPLGGFGDPSQLAGCFGSSLTSGRLTDLVSKFANLTSTFRTASDGLSKISNMFDLARTVQDNMSLLSQARRGAEMNSLVNSNYV